MTICIKTTISYRFFSAGSLGNTPAYLISLPAQLSFLLPHARCGSLFKFGHPRTPTTARNRVQAPNSDRSPDFWSLTVPRPSVEHNCFLSICLYQIRISCVDIQQNCACGHRPQAEARLYNLTSWHRQGHKRATTLNLNLPCLEWNPLLAANLLPAVFWLSLNSYKQYSTSEREPRTPRMLLSVGAGVDLLRTIFGMKWTSFLTC